MRLAQHHLQQIPGILQCKGAAVVELAVVLVLMTLLCVGIFEFSRAFWYYNALDKATRDAARYLSALPATDLSNATKATASVATAKQLVVNSVNGSNINPALASSNVNVTWDCALPCGGVKPLWVKVGITGYTVKIGGTLPFIGVINGNYGNIPLQPATELRYMN